LIGASVQRVEQGTALVDQAGATMQEIVQSIARVTDIMGEISSASAEQSVGVSQVGEAVAQMDQATQQNAALVEESAAAASSLNTQAQQLVQAVSVFKVTGGGLGMPATPRLQAGQIKKPSRPALARVEPANTAKAARPERTLARPPMRHVVASGPKLALATDSGSWESF